MSDCDRLSERMPAVALGRSMWSAEDSAHLEECRSCREEWALIRLAGRLGRDVRGGLDPEAMTRALLDRLSRAAEEERLRKRAWGFAAVAAAAAAMVWATQTVPVAPSRGPPVASLEIQLPELDNLLPAELNAVLQTMDEPSVGGSAADTAAGDPDGEDLDTGFDTWEG